MRIRRALPALAALLATVAVAPAAGAQTPCTHPASAYDTGGPPVGGAANDPLFPRQWGLDQVNAPEAWARGARGAGTVVAVLDSGVDLTHPDLQAKLVPGNDFVPGGGACAGPQDEDGHGTHVAGIAAAVTGNGAGVAGTAPDAAVMPVRVLNDEGEGGPEEIIAGIRWAADNGADVVNLSLGQAPIVGQSEQLNEDIEQAVDYAYARGAVIVAAAGNESFPLCSYPSAARRAVCVGATDRGGAPAAYSNFPADPDDTVAVRAPGGEGSPIFCEYDEDIWSTIWPASSSDCNDPADVGGYDTVAGTSMASPFVAGVAALLKGRGLSNGQVVECLRTTSSTRGRYDPVMGYGIVDANAATATCAPATTPTFTPPPNAPPRTDQPPPPDSGPALSVTVSRTTRRRLIRSGRIRVRIRSDRAVSVKLRAELRSGRRRATLSRRTVRLSRAGYRRATIRLSRRARRRIARSRRGRVLVAYRAGSAAGTATAARR